MTIQETLTQNRNKVIAGLISQFEFSKIELTIVMADFVNYLISEEWTAQELQNTINFQKNFDQLLSSFANEMTYPIHMGKVGEFQAEQNRKQANAAGIF